MGWTGGVRRNVPELSVGETIKRREREGERRGRRSTRDRGGEREVVKVEV